MKYIAILFFILFSTLLAHAQELSPAKCNISSRVAGNTHTIFVKMTLDKGWHVFDPNPGGDGLLIAPEIKLTNSVQFKKISPLTVSKGTMVTKLMEGIGDVNYYEKEVMFQLSFEAENIKTVQGVFTYQLCNDVMCLPPEDIEFTVRF